MRRWVIVALWLAGTVAASSLAFVAVAMVGDVAAAPSAVLAPVDAADGRPGELVLAEGTVAVECVDPVSASLSWAQPAGGADLVIRETGPPTVVVDFTSDDEVTTADIACVDGVPVPTVSRRSIEQEPETSTTIGTPSTTEPDDDDEVSTPGPGSTTSSTTTEPDDDDTTSTTEPDDDDTTSTTEPDDDDTTSTTESDDDD